MKKALPVLCLLTLLAIPLSSAHAGEYLMRQIGVRSEDWGSCALDINNAGQVLCEDLNSSTIEAFLWSKTAGRIVLAGPGGLDEPGGINNVGQIVGSRYISWPGVAVLRNPDGQVIIIDALVVTMSSHAWAINDVGQVVGVSDVQVIMVDLNANTAIVLGSRSLPGAITGLNINNAGQVAWSSCTYYQWPDQWYTIERVFRWDAVNGSIELPLLPGAGRCGVRDINDAGDIVGYSGDHAVLWKADGSVVDLGIGGACGINSLGQIVGDLGNHAVLWNPDGGVVDLGMPPGAGSTYARAINDLGQIVGEYYSDSFVGPRAILWEPVPEPHSYLALAGLSALMAGSAVRGRRRLTKRSLH